MIPLQEGMSGRSKPPFVSSGIQLSAKPGQKTGRLCLSCSGLHPQGFAVSPYPVSSGSAGYSHGRPCFSPFGSAAFIAKNRPYRFCAIAVTLATRTCVRLRARWVGGLSSAARFRATVGRSLPLLFEWGAGGDKGSDGIWFESNFKERELEWLFQVAFLLQSR